MMPCQMAPGKMLAPIGSRGAQCAAMDSFKPRQVRAALRKVPNVADFCRRHTIPERTVYRLRSQEELSPRGAVVRVLGQALVEDGLLTKPKEPAHGKAKA
jgi:hypothetical protein